MIPLRRRRKSNHCAARISIMHLDFFMCSPESSFNDYGDCRRRVQRTARARHGDDEGTRLSGFAGKSTIAADDSEKGDDGENQHQSASRPKTRADPRTVHKAETEESKAACKQQAEFSRSQFG